MKNTAIIMILFLVSYNSYGFTLNDGLFVSNDGCNVNIETFAGHTNFEDGSKYIDIEFYKANIDQLSGQIIDEVYYSERKILSPSYENLLSSSSLCGDAETKMPNAVLVQKSSESLEFKCGGTLSAIDENLKISSSANGDLSELKFINQIAKFSISETLFSPLPKSTVAEFSCSNFIKQ